MPLERSLRSSIIRLCSFITRARVGSSDQDNLPRLVAHLVDGPLWLVAKEGIDKRGSRYGGG
jgi:hypothetical protein